MTDIGRYVPREVAEKLEAARRRGGRPEGERRIVTVLFCDVKGSTAMAEGLDPEEWAEIMNGAFEHLIGPVYRYEGVVARLMGDAILAFFGAPIAHEDDPERAVLAGLAILESIAPYRERLRRERGLQFDVRVGINTGLAVLGEVGSDLRVEYTAMGDAVNVAARMEQTATPGTVHVSAHTQRLIEGLFDVEPLGPVEVKGKTEPVQAYRVLGRSARPVRARLAAPLVGRDGELARLIGAAEAVRAGQGRIAWITGEAGLGKSRLVQELRSTWDLAWWEGGAIAYESAQPYGVFLKVLRAAVGAADERADRVAEMVGRAVDSAGAPARVSAVLATLFGAPAPDALEGEALKREIHVAARELFRSLAPSAVVCEDLHWGDAASLELFGALFALVPEAPLLFVCTSRPGSAHGDRLLTTAREERVPALVAIALAPLAEREAASLVESLVYAAGLDASVRDAVRAKGEGNPFFVEELVRAVAERGSVSGIPDTLQALLMARIDRLDEDARRTMQQAAVVGRSFARRILEAISDAADRLDEDLAALLRADLVRPESPPDGYEFRHALTQETAYGSILLRRRRELHRRVAEALEAIHGSGRGEHAALLAHHFHEARDPRAVGYLTLAGDSAARLYANAEAAVHFGRALEIALAGQPEREALLHLYTARGRALELDSRFADAVANYEDMRRVAGERGDRATRLVALVAHATLRVTPNPERDPALARTLLDEALAVARELGDHAAEAKVLWNLMLLHVHGDVEGTGAADRPIELGERSVAIAREHGLREQLAFSLHDLHHAYMAAGDLLKVDLALSEARRYWSEAGNLPMLADSLSSSAINEHLLGKYESALALADEAYRISERIGNVWGKAYSRRSVGLIWFERGYPDRAIEVMTAGIELGERAGLVPMYIVGSELAWICGELGAFDRALDLAGRALARADQMPLLRRGVVATHAWIQLRRGDLESAATALRDLRGSPLLDVVSFAFCLIPLTRAELALARGEPAEALELLDGLIARQRRMHAHVRLADCLLLKASALRALGSPREDELREALAEAEAIGSTWARWRVLLALGDRDAAARIVRDIASRISDERLRASFLDRPDAREALDRSIASGS